MKYIALFLVIVSAILFSAFVIERYQDWRRQEDEIAATKARTHAIWAACVERNSLQRKYHLSVFEYHDCGEEPK